MKYLLAAIGLMTVLSSSVQAASSEGLVSERGVATVEPGRQSLYQGRSASTGGIKFGELTRSKLQAGNANPTQIRPSGVQKSEKASYFYFYDAHAALHADRDADGYHSEFTVRFDADTTLGDVLVYAKLYLRRVGESDWVLYHVTDDFWINGESNDDYFFVRTSLDGGFATSEYDVLIDLYESGGHDVVATIDYTDASELGLLPLEEAGLDVPIEESGFSIGDVQTTLLTDNDQDGHYSKFEIAFDPDADLQSGYLYARVWIRPEGGEWIQEHVSDDFPVDTFGQNDVYAFTAEWVSCYPTAYYDVQIDLYDASTNLLVASAGSERLDLSRIPLEDQNQDRKISAPVTGDNGSVTSHEHGGGGVGTVLCALLATLILLRAVLQRQRVRVDR